MINSQRLLCLIIVGVAAGCLGAEAQSQAQKQNGNGNNQVAGSHAKGAASEAGPQESVGGWPKFSFNNLASLDYAQMSSRTGPGRGPGFAFWSDTTMLVEFNDSLSLDGLFQFKPRAPLPATNPNRDLFINRGLDRAEGGKMKELYVRYDSWRVGKFVQDFGRAYSLLPGPWASDFIEEPEQGYEPSDMIGVENIYVFDNEDSGWQQLSVSAFMVDRTFLHESFPFNEGIVHYRDGGVGNTLLPENIMVTWDNINMPVDNWAQLTYQASVIRYGRSYGAERGEWWTTLGGDLAVPLTGSVSDTLGGSYSQLRFYVEAARRDNFGGFAGRARNFLSGSAEYMRGPWVLDLTTTQRWTTDRALPLQKDELYSASVGYTLPSQTIISLSAGPEKVGAERGLYFGLRLTQTLTLCSKCILTGSYF
jgi:hypothetical protein